MAGFQTGASLALVIPDWVETIFLNGSVSMTNIQTVSQAAWLGKVSEFIMLNGGGGYDPANPPVVTLTGGGGSGALAVASVSGAGMVVNLTLVYPGSGYTSAPAVAIATSPSGLTATARASINCNNAVGRKITILASNAMTLNNANNIALPTSSIAISANSCVDLMGGFDGRYYLRSRAI
jgi:hypothetical protein